MSQDSLVGTRWVELGLAVLTGLVGTVVMYSSYEQGLGWSDSGPEPGYFPFYIGLLLSLASLGNLLLAAWRWQALADAFVGQQAFRQVLSVALPMLLFVIALPFVGLYLSAAFFIGWFMWRDRLRERPFRWPTIAAVSGSASLACYLVFALWFKVPLEAGPLGTLVASLGGM
jgi:hypothetical protein